VDIRQLGLGFVLPSAPKLKGVELPKQPVVPAKQPDTGTAPAGDSVNLSLLTVPTPPATENVTSFTPSTIRLKPAGGGAGNSGTTCLNSPLTMGMDLEPVYLEELGPIATRYPGVASALKNFEAEAFSKGYCPVASKSLEASVLESPPWPKTSFGDPRENISAKAKELQASNPDLNTNDASKYDFNAASVSAANLLGTLDTMFPVDQFSGVAMTTRAKAPGSLAKKMEKMTGKDSAFTLAHLTDTVGARIDASDLTQMGKVASALEKQFEGKIVAKSDYVSEPGENGYRAIHYIIDIGGRMAEIQTSTTSLRMADLVTHDTVYKKEFPVSKETSQELSTAADRIMFLECLKTKGSG
jgi:hypothetical protein